MLSSWPSLTATLAQNLPEGVELQCYHTSTPPTRCLDIYAPAPNQLPEKTYSESHSLTVSITSTAGGREEQVAIYAIELILYTTAKLSTLFVSKADSTGYAFLLKFPKSSGSVLQLITRTFISWLVKCRARPRQRTVLSLFARAQDQYLFPGSAENDKKHVLDDRGLVKWWCKTLDSVAREYPPESSRIDPSETLDPDRKTRSKGYLIVPGHDPHETTAFFPAQARQDPPDCKRWFNDHPLRQISNQPTAPPRCLIPHFPDDPKSRFLDELDEEIADIPSSQQAKLESPSKRGAGQWKSVKTLEQFWDMMAFRQECSSGRLVGFIWVVFTPPDADDIFNSPQRSRSTSPTPLRRKNHHNNHDQPHTTPPLPPHPKSPRQKLPLTGPILPRPPRVKSGPNSTITPSSRRPERTRHYIWPKGTRGTLVLAQKEYDRVHEILLRLDFATLEVAAASTKKWVMEAAVIAGVAREDWGVRVVGEMVVQQRGAGAAAAGATNGGGVNVLTAKRKRKVVSVANEDVASTGQTSTAAVQTPTTQPPAPNVLGNGLVRKKPKTESNTNAVVDAATPVVADGIGNGNGNGNVNVNLLGAGLVRKKAKVV